MMTAQQIKKKFPKAYQLYLDSSYRNKIGFFDSIGIRILMSYASSGGFKVTIYHNDPDRILDGHFKPMIRLGHIQTYQDRKEATLVGHEIAFSLLESIIVSGKFETFCPTLDK